MGCLKRCTETTDVDDAAKTSKLRLTVWVLLFQIQFCVGLGFGINAIFSGCKFTRWMQYAFIAYAFSFLVLFGNFYVHAYRSRVRTRKIKSGISLFFTLRSLFY